MNMSFYTASTGAYALQEKINVLSNNLSNVNTTAYKAKNPVFADLVYHNMRGVQNQQGNLRTGTGIRLDKTDTQFHEGSYDTTDQELDFAIKGEGFFALYDPITQQTQYTRDGRFSMSDQGEFFYLVSSDGKHVLDSNNQPIQIESTKDNLDIGIFDFADKNGMESVGFNRFTPVAKNGQPVLAADSSIMKNRLESSNVDYGTEMSRVIESQRAFQYALKMISTSDEIEGVINSLR